MQEQDSDGVEKFLIVFLDVDGVLNTASTGKSLELELVDILSRFLLQQPTKIVFSSTWRYNNQHVRIIDALVERGIERDAFIGKTPDLSAGEFFYPPSSHHRTRTDEILMWLRFNGEHGQETSQYDDDIALASDGRVPEGDWMLPCRIGVQNFIAIDDIPLQLRSCFATRANMEDHLIHTSVAHGFNEEKLREAEERVATAEFDMFQWARGAFGACTNAECCHSEPKEKREKRMGKCGQM